MLRKLTRESLFNFQQQVTLEFCQAKNKSSEERKSLLALVQAIEDTLAVFKDEEMPKKSPFAQDPTTSVAAILKKKRGEINTIPPYSSPIVEEVIENALRKEACR